MKTLLELIAELRSVDSDVPENVPTFEGLLADIVTLRTPASIVPLLGMLRDNAQHDELMFSIIHALEIFDDRTYISQVLIDAPVLCIRSPRWASIIFMRILNSEVTRVELVRQLRHAMPEVKEAIKNLMEKINARSEQFLQKTAVVLVATSLQTQPSAHQN